MLRILKQIFTSKYLITGIAFAVWMLFFDRNDLPLQFKRAYELQKLKANEGHMDQKIAETKQELNLLKNNPETLEKYAREKFLMKRDNEDLFVITPDSSSGE